MTNRIRELREARGLSLEALAGLVGTTNQQISHLEAGRRRLTVDWLHRLGAALSCHPWALVAEESTHYTSGKVGPQETLLLEAFRRLSPERRLAVLTLIAEPKQELA